MNIKSMLNIIKNYRWQSLFFTYWKIMLVAFAIPILVIFLIFFNFYDKSHQKELEHLATASAAKSREVMGVISNDIDNFFYTMMTDDDVLTFLDSENPKPNTIENQEVYYNVQAKVQNLKLEYSFIDSIFLYASKSGYVQSTASGERLDEHPMGDFLKSVINSENSTSVNHLAYGDEKGLRNCITIAYPMLVSQYREPDGFIIINLNSKLLAEYLENDYVNERIIVLTDEGEIVYSPEELEQSGSDSFYRENIKTFETENYLARRERGSVFCYFPVSDMGMALGIEVPVESMKTMLNSYMGTIILLFILLLLVIFIISIYTSFVMYKSIADIISNFGITANSEDEQSNELKMISNNFLSILKREEDIKYELTNKVKTLKQSQVLALQTQINPHFLFNTLHLVNLMIMRITGGDNKPARIITLLSDVMQYTMRSDGYMTTLRDEVEYVRKYIEIEQIKSNYSFDFKIQIDEELMDCVIVKFTLQPILENSIIHGFKKAKDENKRIVLSADKDESTLHISVENNGIGLDAETALRMNKRFNMKTQDITSNHIGLSNVNGRIKLLCGELYGVQVVPLDKGVRTDIIYPLKYAEK